MLHPIATTAVPPLDGRDTPSWLLSGKLEFHSYTPLRGVGCTIHFEGNWALWQDRNSSADVTSLFPPSLNIL